jgi:hypothetical protein
MSKLTNSDIIDIRRMSDMGMSSIAISAEMGIGDRHIRKIVTGEIWNNVPEDQTIKNFPNYAITSDGRVWSHTKQAYVAVKKSNGKMTVKLSKTDKNGKRTQQTVEVDALMSRYFN